MNSFEAIWQPSSPTFRNLMSHHQKTLSPYLTQWLGHAQPNLQPQFKTPPVLLLTGPRGIGKKAVARRLAQILLSPLGTATPTLTETLGPIPDYLLTELSPQDGNEDSVSKSETLKVDQFRKLKEKMGFGNRTQMTPASQVILIPQAERMTAQAANSILKLLEEPPAGWVFILTANDSTLLLPTLVSRCQKIQLAPIPESELTHILSQLTEDSRRASFCAQIAEGSLERATLFLEDEIWEKRKVILEFTSYPNRRPGLHFKELMDWATESGTTERIELFVDLLEQTLSEHILKHATLAPTATPERYQFWMRQSEKLCEVREKLRAPTNRKILIQDLLMPWLGAPA